MVSDVLNDVDADLNHFNELYPSLHSSSEQQYYDSDKFNSTFNLNTRNDLSIIHANIRSLSANGDMFVGFLSLLNRSFDVICFTETWLSQDGVVENFFPSYNGHHISRSTRRGGGVAIYIKK